MKLTDEQRVSLYAELRGPRVRGEQSLLARKYGVSTAYVSTILKEGRHLWPNAMSAQSAALRAEKKARDTRIVDMLRRGDSVKFIALKEQCSPALVYALRAMAGLKQERDSYEGQFTRHWEPKRDRTQPVLPQQLPGSMIKPPTYAQLTVGRARG
jgi:hypothetical protein